MSYFRLDNDIEENKVNIQKNLYQPNKNETIQLNHNSKKTLLPVSYPTL